MRHQLAAPDPIRSTAEPVAPVPCSGAPGEKLLGRRVLIVEDEALVAIDLQFAFEDAGAEVLGPAMSLTDAMAMAEQADQIDCALLDVDLAGHDIYPVATVLQRRGIPFIFHTGHGSRRKHCEMFPGAITCLKPTLPETLIDLLAGL
jgi:CheY-like chemotaxis protein